MNCLIQLKIHSVVALLATFSIVPFAFAVDGDFDGDGVSDALIIRIPESKVLRWRAYTSSSSFATVSKLGEHGTVGDNLIPANWLSPTSADIGIVRKDGTDVVWSVQDSEGKSTQHTFGTVADYLISGADLDGSGITDAVALKRGGRVEIGIDMFAPGADRRASVELQFPRRAARHGRPVFFRAPGKVADSLGIIQAKKTRKRRTVYLLHVRSLSGENERFNLGGVFGREPRDVMPLKNPQGEDVFLFVSGGRKTRVKVKSLGGELLYRESFYKKRTVVTGNYLPAAGDEFAVETGNESILVSNPFSGESLELNVGPGVIADHVNVVTFRSVSDGGSNGGSNGGGSGEGETSPPGEGLGSVCSSVSDIRHGVLYKPESDVSDNRGGKPAILLTGANKTGTGDLKLFASDGSQVCNFTYKESSVSGVNNDADHYYSGWHGGCDRTGSQIAAAARTASGSSNVYIQWRGGGCLGPVNPTQRTGGI